MCLREPVQQKKRGALTAMTQKNIRSACRDPSLCEAGEKGAHRLILADAADIVD